MLHFIVADNKIVNGFVMSSVLKAIMGACWKFVSKLLENLDVDMGALLLRTKLAWPGVREGVTGLEVGKKRGGMAAAIEDEDEGSQRN